MLPGGREGHAAQHHQRHREVGTGDSGGLAQRRVGLAHGQGGQGLAAEREPPARHLGQGEQRRQGDPPGPPRRAQGGRHREVGGEDGTGHDVAGGGEVPHPQQARDEPGEGGQPGAPEPSSPAVPGDEPIDEGDAHEGQRPPAPRGDGGGDAEPGQDGAAGDGPAGAGGCVHPLPTAWRPVRRRRACRTGHQAEDRVGRAGTSGAILPDEAASGGPRPGQLRHGTEVNDVAIRNSKGRRAR